MCGPYLLWVGRDPFLSTHRLEAPSPYSCDELDYFTHGTGRTVSVWAEEPVDFIWRVCFSPLPVRDLISNLWLPPSDLPTILYAIVSILRRTHINAQVIIQVRYIIITLPPARFYALPNTWYASLNYTILSCDKPSFRDITCTNAPDSTMILMHRSSAVPTI